MIGKLIGAASVGGTLANVGMLNRFLTGIVSIVILAVVSAFLLCGLIAGVFTLAYLALVHYGLEPYVATITLSIVGLMLVTISLTLTMSKIRELRSIPLTGIQKHFAALPDFTSLIENFVQGFLRNKKDH